MPASDQPAGAWLGWRSAVAHGKADFSKWTSLHFRLPGATTALCRIAFPPADQVLEWTTLGKRCPVCLSRQERLALKAAATRAST